MKKVLFLPIVFGFFACASTPAGDGRAVSKDGESLGEAPDEDDLSAVMNDAPPEDIILKSEHFGEQLNLLKEVPENLDGEEYTGRDFFLSDLREKCTPMRISTHQGMGVARISTDEFKDFAVTLMLSDVREYYTDTEMAQLRELVNAALQNNSIKPDDLPQKILWAGPVEGYSSCSVVKESEQSPDFLQVFHFNDKEKAYEFVKELWSPPTLESDIRKLGLKLSGPSTSTAGPFMTRTKINGVDVITISKQNFRYSRHVTTGKPFKEIIAETDMRQKGLKASVLGELESRTRLLDGEVSVLSLDDAVTFQVATRDRFDRDGVFLWPTTLLSGDRFKKEAGNVLKISRLKRSDFAPLHPKLEKLFQTKSEAHRSRLSRALGEITDETDPLLAKLIRILDFRQMEKKIGSPVQSSEKHPFFGHHQYLQERNAQRKGLSATASCTDEGGEKHLFNVSCFEEGRLGSISCERVNIPEPCRYLERFAQEHPKEARQKYPDHYVYKYLPTKMPQQGGITFGRDVERDPDVEEFIWDEIIKDDHPVVWSTAAHELLDSFATAQVRDLKAYNNMQYNVIRYTAKLPKSFKDKSKFDLSTAGCNVSVHIDTGYDGAHVWLTKGNTRYQKGDVSAFDTREPSEQMQRLAVADIASVKEKNITKTKLSAEQREAFETKFSKELRERFLEKSVVFPVRQEGDCANQNALMAKVKRVQKWLNDYMRIYMKVELIDSYQSRVPSITYEKRLCFKCKDSSRKACLGNSKWVQFDEIRRQCEKDMSREQAAWLKVKPQKKGKNKPKKKVKNRDNKSSANRTKSFEPLVSRR